MYRSEVMNILVQGLPDLGGQHFVPVSQLRFCGVPLSHRLQLYTTSGHVIKQTWSKVVNKPVLVIA